MLVNAVYWVPHLGNSSQGRGSGKGGLGLGNSRPLKEGPVVVTRSSGEEARVVADLIAGSARAEAALEHIYRHHGGAVLSFVARCTGDESVAEHVVAEVFVHLWRQPQSFDPSAGSLRSHLVKYAHCRCMGLVGLEQSQANQHGYEQPADNWDDADDRGPDGRAGTARGAGGGWEALSLDERLAIGLVQWGGMSSTEVAEFLGVDEDTVHSRLTGGLQRLAAGPPR